MHDIVSIQHFERLEDLLKKLVSLGFGEAPLLLDHLIEGATIAELIDEIVVVSGFEHIDVGYYIGAFVAYLRQDIDLIDGALLQLRRILELLRRYDLYCELLACHDVLGLVDFGEGALPHQLHQRVLLDCLTHCGCARYYIQ